MFECLECGAESTGPVMACARCRAPITALNPVEADRTAGESVGSAALADPGHQPPAKSPVPDAAWWPIGGGAAVLLGSLLPWISAYVFDANISASADPNLFKAVEVGNSVSGGVRAAAAIFGLTLIGLGIAIQSTSARGVFVKPQAYAYAIPLIALSMLGILGCGIFAVAGYLGFREANGPGIIGYGIFTLVEKHPVLGLDGTAGSAHVSFAPNAGLVIILFGCIAAITGAIGSFHYASARPPRAAAQPKSGGADPMAGAINCLECGAAPAEAVQVCRRCGAPVAQHPPMPADAAAGTRPDSRRNVLVMTGAGLAVLTTVIVVIAVANPRTPSRPSAVSRPSASSRPATSTAATSEVSLDDLQAGDCLTGSDLELNNGGWWPDFVTVVPCRQQHTGEVFFAGNAWPASAAYPGDHVIDSQAQNKCDAEFGKYDGIPVDSSALTYDFADPSGGGDWASGDRWVLCVAYDPTSQYPGGEPVNYSIKGSNQ
jgi:hypothetical protein